MYNGIKSRTFSPSFLHSAFSSFTFISANESSINLKRHTRGRRETHSRRDSSQSHSEFQLQSLLASSLPESRVKSLTSSKANCKETTTSSRNCQAYLKLLFFFDQDFVFVFSEEKLLYKPIIAKAITGWKFEIMSCHLNLSGARRIDEFAVGTHF